MQCHEVDYEILGDDIQMVEIELDQGETVVAEAGAMNYMQDGISFEAKMGDGSNPNEGIMGKLLSAGKRVLTGESIFLTHFTNTGSGKKRVAFAAPYPGQIIPIDLTQHGGMLFCQKDAFLCAAISRACPSQGCATVFSRMLPQLGALARVKALFLAVSATLSAVTNRCVPMHRCLMALYLLVNKDNQFTRP